MSPGTSVPGGAFTVLQHAGARPLQAVRPLPPPPPPHPPPATMLDPKFTRALDYKLRRLKQRERQQAGRAALKPPLPPGRAHESPSPRRPAGPGAGAGAAEKPRFVTTVCAGRFLPPPPDVAALLGLESLYPEEPRVYSYRSRPQPVPRARRAAPAAPTAPTLTSHGARALFAGVRALVAGGVAGLRRLQPRPRHGDAGDGEGRGFTNNLMHDKRVVRGSTHAQHPMAAGDGATSLAARAAATRRRALARRAAAASLRPGTPPPAPGRRHHPIQTEYYLEELFDKGVEMTVGVQTDLFLDRPATPLYVPAKTGADQATQIYPGDLFDFDVEVSAVLSALVGGTAEQALCEVAREEELAALREHQRRFRELRDAERAERERLACQDRRLHDEKERRVSEARLARLAAQEARARVAAAALVQGYVAELLPAALAGLRAEGYLVERIHRGVDDEFVPWLTQAVSTELESIITSRDLITELVREVVEARAELYAARGEREWSAESPPESVTPPSELGEGEEEEDEPEKK